MELCVKRPRSLLLGFPVELATQSLVRRHLWYLPTLNHLHHLLPVPSHQKVDVPSSKGSFHCCISHLLILGQAEYLVWIDNVQ